MPHAYVFVYQTINEINGKSYVGVHSTNDINDGYIGCGIYKKSDAYKHHLFHRAVRKYGYNSFRRYILSFYDSRKEANEEERFIVNEKWVLNKNNYNAAIGGSGGFVYESTEQKVQKYKKISDKNRGQKRSKEFCENLSNRNKGRKFTESHKAKMRENHSRFWKGKKRAEETKRKQSLTCTGRKLSDYHRSRLSESHKGKPAFQSMKPIIQYDKFMNIVNEFGSTQDAVFGLKIKRSTISMAIKNNWLCCGKYYFKTKQK